MGYSAGRTLSPSKVSLPSREALSRSPAHAPQVPSRNLVIDHRREKGVGLIGDIVIDHRREKGVGLIGDRCLPPRTHRGLEAVSNAAESGWVTTRCPPALSRELELAIKRPRDISLPWLFFIPGSYRNTPEVAEAMS